MLTDLPLELIGTLGFPIFVAVWMLWRDSKTIKELEKALNKNTVVLEGLRVIVNKCNKK